MDDARSQAQFSELYRDNYGRVLRFIGRRVGATTDAEDLAAEVFRIAWSKTRQEGGVVPAAWLFGVARNSIRNNVRSDMRRQELNRLLAQHPASSTTGETGYAVHEALSQLRDGDREILMMRYWDELSPTEMSTVLEISLSAVWVRLHRARRAVRDLMKTTGDAHVTH